MGAAQGFTSVSPDTRFGSTETGYGYYGNYTIAQRFTMPGSGSFDIAEIGAYLRVPGTSRNCKFAIFTDDATNVCPEAMVTNSLSAEITISETSHTKKCHSYSTKPQVTGGVNYWLGIICNSTGSYYLYVSENSLVSTTQLWRNDTYPNFPSAATWHSHTHNNTTESLYAVYETPPAPGSIPLIDYHYNNMRP